MQDWQEPVPTLHINSNQLEEVDSFVSLERVLKDAWSIEKVISAWISRGMLAFAHRQNISKVRVVGLPTKARMANTWVRVAKLFDYDTWSLRAADAKKLSDIDYRYIRHILHIKWEQRGSNVNIFFENI